MLKVGKLREILCNSAAYFHLIITYVTISWEKKFQYTLHVCPLKLNTTVLRYIERVGDGILSANFVTIAFAVFV